MPLSAATRAVLIGIDKYKDAAPVSYLNFADEDATALNDHLRDPRGGALSDVFTYADGPPGRLPNSGIQAPTMTYIKHALDDVLSGAGEQDDIYLFFSARGQATYEHPEGYISAADTDKQRPSTGIRVAELAAFLKRSNARRIFLFADVCREASINRFDNRINLRLVDLQKSKRSLEVVLASGPSQISVEIPDLHHGVFGYSLLAALQGQPFAAADSDHNRVITAKELFDFLKREFTRYPGARQTPYPAPRDPSTPVYMPPLPGAHWRPSVPPMLFASALPHAAAARGHVIGGLPALLPFAAFQAAPPVLPPAQQFARDILQLLRSGAGADSPALAQALDEAKKAALPPADVSQLAYALENEGQLVVARYGTGDQFPGDPLELTAGDFLRAEAAFYSARQLRPADQSLHSRELFCRGRQLLYRTGTDLEAERVLADSIAIDRRIASTYPHPKRQQSPDPHNALGILYLQQRKFGRAISEFREAIEAAPEWSYPRHNLALTFTEQGKESEAEREYSAAIDQAPYYPFLYYNLALLLQRTNQREKAESEYRKALEVSESQASVYEERSKRWKQDKNDAEADVWAERARQLRRNQGQFYNALGALYESLPSRRGEADGQYRKAIGADREMWAAPFNLGVLYLSQSRAQEALSPLLDAVNLAPHQIVVRMKLAEAYRSVGRFTHAECEYRMVIGKDPENFEAGAGLARVLAERTPPDMDAAIHAMLDSIRAQQAQRNPPQRGQRLRQELLASPDSYKSLGLFYRQAGREPEACNAFESARKASKQGAHEAVSDLRKLLKTCR
jgi:tetratricopeptide (TPR) repeat protein